MQDKDNTSPKQNIASPSLGHMNLDGLFDKIAKGLEKYNQREEEKKQHHKKGSRKRFSDQFAPLRKTAAAANAKKLPSCLATTPSVGAPSLATTFDLQSKTKPSSSIAATINNLASVTSPVVATSSCDVNRRTSIFDMQPKTTKPSSSSYGSYYRLPPGSVLSSSYDSSPCRRLSKVKKPVPVPMKFDPPSFTFGKSTTSRSSAAESSSVQSVLAGMVSCDDKGVDPPKEETSAIIEDSHTPRSGSDAQTEGLAKSIIPPRDQADDTSSSTTKQSGKKRNAFMFDIESTSSQDFTYGYGCNPFPPPTNQQFGKKKYSKEDVDGLVAFADKWIPHPKKRRMDEKK